MHITSKSVPVFQTTIRSIHEEIWVKTNRNSCKGLYKKLIGMPIF